VDALDTLSFAIVDHTSAGSQTMFAHGLAVTAPLPRSR